MSDYLSVSHLTKYLKLKFDRDPYLERVYLTGQVSNFRKRPSHQYFSLKDDKAVIQATMWAGVFRNLPFDLEEGMQLNVVGRIQLYEPNGSYAIIIEKAEPDGVGRLALQFEQLRRRLTEQGYFDAKHKQKLPRFVRRIGVITSPSGAVIKDIITTVSRRFPGVEIVLYPTKVQGEGAAQEVVNNIIRANERSDIDVLIVGRGGGSIEDLWAFNEECVVQAIFESRLPVISSVGHETDTTLADFVADVRAATPTAAAELATPVSKSDVMAFLTERQARLYQSSQRLVMRQTERLTRLSQSVIFRQPERLYDTYLQALDKAKTRLQASMGSQLSTLNQQTALLEQRLLGLEMPYRIRYYHDKLGHLERLLKSHIKAQYQGQKQALDKAYEALLSLDSRRIVARGYAMLERDKRLLTSVQGIESGMTLTVIVKDGQLKVEVRDVTTTKNI